MNVKNIEKVVFYYSVVRIKKKVMKYIKLPSNTEILLLSIRNNRYLSLSNGVTAKYMIIPPFISINKIEKRLLLKNVSNSNNGLFFQFSQQLQFELNNLSINYKKKLILKGLGYRAVVNEEAKIVEFKLGFSHLIRLRIPEKIKIKVKKQFINLESKDKILLGNFVNKIVKLKSPDSYKGKGFWYKYQNKTLKVVKKK